MFYLESQVVAYLLTWAGPRLVRAWMTEGKGFPDEVKRQELTPTRENRVAAPDAGNPAGHPAGTGYREKLAQLNRQELGSREPQATIS